MKKDMPNTNDYVNQKQVAKSLQSAVKNWKRKIEIAEIAAKEA